MTILQVDQLIFEAHSSKLFWKMGICSVVTIRPVLFVEHWGNITDLSDFVTSCIFFYSVYHLPCSQRFARVIVMKRIVSLLLIWLWILEVKLSVFVLGSALETDCRNVSWMCLVQLVFFKILLVYTIKTKVEVKHSASSKDLLHIKIKGNVMFKGVKIVFAFPGLCCILKDHKGQA